MDDVQSTVVGLKAQDCPGGGWNGMPSELVGKATVADCLAHGVCGCIYGDAVKHIERLSGVLRLLKRYRDETPLGHQPHMIAHEVDEVIARATNPNQSR